MAHPSEGAHGSRKQWIRAYGEEPERKSVRRHDFKREQEHRKLMKGLKSPFTKRG